MTQVKMTESMRWFGPGDPVSLRDIAQAGCSSVVSALHNYAPGEVWPYEEIAAYKRHIDSAGLGWEVVESLPVHDHIKMGYPDRDLLIDNYTKSLRNLAKAGVYIVTYNFMPLLDWLRTDIHHRTPSGAEILYFSRKDYAVFDLFVLERAGAADAFTAEEVAALRAYADTMEADRADTLSKSLLMALPGTEEHFTPDLLKRKLAEYAHITPEQLRENLVYFLEKICPVADELGVHLTIHPDDPPFPVFGLPRIASTYQDLRYLFERVPNPSNGLCFCTGSLGARLDNDLVQILGELGSRVRFLHLRNTKTMDNGDFYEADHLYGDTDMYAVIREVLALMSREGRNIVMRPDHGPRIMDDLQKEHYPGYSVIGRLKGLAELRGVEYALLRSGDYITRIS